MPLGASCVLGRGGLASPGRTLCFVNQLCMLRSAVQVRRPGAAHHPAAHRQHVGAQPPLAHAGEVQQWCRCEWL